MSDYIPKLDDYVIWKQKHFTDEGWIYFKCPSYVTIEVGVKDKSEENIKDSPLHKKTHVLVVCQSQYWNELEYVKNRRNQEDTYKSQEHRYSDP